jgi:transcriptional regulator with XRE-family HTH domain
MTKRTGGRGSSGDDKARGTVDHKDMARRIFAMGGLSLAARARALGTDRRTLDRIVCGLSASEATYRQLLPLLEALEAAYRELVPSDGNVHREGDLDAYREERREGREAVVARRVVAKERFNARVCAELAPGRGRRS